MNGYNFTGKVRKALMMARTEAQRLSHEYVGTEHILLGVLLEPTGTAVVVIEKLGASPTALASAIEHTVTRTTGASKPGHDLPYTSRAKKVLELAMTAALDLGDNFVGTEHLLLGLLMEKKGIAALVLDEAGITVESASAQIKSLSDRGEQFSGSHQSTPVRRSGSNNELLRHALATLAYRGGKALRGAPPELATFRAATATRTPAEILAHIGDLLDWGCSIVQGDERWQSTPPDSWVADVARFHAALARLDAMLAAAPPVRVSPERLFQGPIADALTHVGQLTMLRRLAGAPVRGEDYSRADIEPGRIGPEQTPPKREFD